MTGRQTQALQRDLRSELVPWTYLPYVIGGLVLAILDTDGATPKSWTSIGMLLLVPSLAACLVPRAHTPSVGTIVHLLLLSVLVLGWVWFPASELHYAVLIPVVSVSLIQGPAASILMITIATILIVATRPGATSGPFGSLTLFPTLFVTWGVAYLALIGQRPAGTMLHWAWEGYEQAQRHLEISRNRQVELKQALEDLALATSETIRLNQLLTVARQAVEDARRAKEEFVANVSHELRTPLNMIIGFSDMILESPGVYARHLPAALLADVAAIKRNSQHLASLVDDVLDLTEADTGHMQLHKEWLSIGELVEEAIEVVSALFDKKRLSLTASIDADIKPVFCDRTRIRQVILNLLSNAGRFTEQGGAHVEVRMHDSETVCVSVSDTGPGMEPQQLDRVFEPFRQADESIRRRYGGTGLGLAISKRFVEMHGGKIRLESEIGAGTTATFTLPTQPMVDSARPDPSDAKRWFGPYHEYTPRDRRSRAPAIDARPRVVVVEQGRVLSHLISHYIEGLEPIRVATLEEAARMVDSQAAVAVCINEAPTPANGAGQQTLRMSFDIPIFSCWIPEPRAAYGEMGAQDYLVKPISRTDILNSVARIAPTAHSILLADDDPEARQLFGRALASAGRNYMVLHAGSGNAALTLLRERQPDLLLLDLMMPDKDGFAVLEAKAQDPTIRTIPVIIISARDPQREPTVSKTLEVTRPGGLSARDLMRTLEALTQTLQPRFGAQDRPERTGESPASA